MKPEDIVERANLLFKHRSTALSLWQEISENFYPQRADFTLTRYVGEEFAGHLYSSYPVLVHRELSTSFAAMLRPRRQDWFQISVMDDESLSLAAKQWLEDKTRLMKRAMYDRRAQFVKATSQADGDFAAFGQCVITREINWRASSPHLLYRCWHLRDCAWAEKSDTSIGEFYIRWKPTVKELKSEFKNLHPTIANKAGSESLSKVDCMRIVITTDVYNGQQQQFGEDKWVVIYLDIENKHILEEYETDSPGVTLPRWQTVSGSQYAYSPATVAGLPDARLLQAMSLTLLEAGEMSVRPPMIATQDAVRSDIALYPGGITWADVDYDERKGDVLRPIAQDRRGLPKGYEVRDNQMAMLAEAFYINKLTLPPPEGEMTAYEVGQRVEEYIRAALPLFEPLEHEYNGALCEDTFDALLKAGAFGAMRDIPIELQGQDVQFKFVSPLHEAVERRQANAFLEGADLARVALELDPTALAQFDISAAFRSALEGVGVSASHLRDEDEAAEIIQEAQDAQKAEQMADIAKTASSAEADLAKAQAVA